LACRLGPKPGEARRFADRGLGQAVNTLLNPPKAKLTGPAPEDEDGNFAPYDLDGNREAGMEAVVKVRRKRP